MRARIIYLISVWNISVLFPKFLSQSFGRRDEALPGSFGNEYNFHPKRADEQFPVQIE